MNDATRKRQTTLAYYDDDFIDDKFTRQYDIIYFTGGDEL